MFSLKRKNWRWRYYNRKTCGDQKFRIDPFLKGSRASKEQSSGVRIKSGRLKNRLPAVRLGRHFPQAGNRAFSQVVRLFSVAVYCPLSRKAGTSENCGFVLCTKCGPCRTARKQFSKGLRSKTGVQQHPKNTQKRLFRQGSIFTRLFDKLRFLPILKERTADGKNGHPTDRMPAFPGNIYRGDVIRFQYGRPDPVSYTHLDVYKRQEYLFRCP